MKPDAVALRVEKQPPARPLDDADLDVAEWCCLVSMLLVESRQLETAQQLQGRSSPLCIPGLAHKPSQPAAAVAQLSPRAEQMEQHLRSMLHTKVSVCIEALILPNCSHGHHQAGHVILPPHLLQASDYVLLEQWTIQLLSKASGRGTQLSSRGVVQAIKSYLYFSQLSAWLHQEKGAIPGSIAYRISPAGDFCTHTFQQSPEVHQFPECIVRNTVLSISVAALPRLRTIPSPLCSKCHHPPGATPVKRDNERRGILRARAAMVTHAASMLGQEKDEEVSRLTDRHFAMKINQEGQQGQQGQGQALQRAAEKRGFPETRQSPGNQGSPDMRASPEKRASPDLTERQLAPPGDETISSNGFNCREYPCTLTETNEVVKAGPSVHGKKRDPCQAGKKQHSKTDQPLLINEAFEAMKTELSELELKQKPTPPAEPPDEPPAEPPVEPPVEPESGKQGQCKHLRERESHYKTYFSFARAKRRSAPTDSTQPQVPPENHAENHAENHKRKFRVFLESSSTDDVDRAHDLDAPTDNVFQSYTPYSELPESFSDSPLAAKSLPPQDTHDSVFLQEARGASSENRSEPSLIKKCLHKARKNSSQNSQGVKSSLPRAVAQAKFSSSPKSKFHPLTGLPMQSSPAPLKKINSMTFEYDCCLSSPKAIKSSLSCMSLCSSTHDENDNKRCHHKLYSTSAPASTNCLLGNFEESVLNGRIEPSGVLAGFHVEIGASGSFCPRHVRLPVTTYFFHLSEDDAPSPYLGHIDLDSLGRRGYHVPMRGTIQVTLFNPNNTVVKMFVVLYDLSDMPPSSQTFLRQRTVYMPVQGSPSDVPENPIILRHLIHLRFASSHSGKIYLHSDVRLIFSQDHVEYDPKVASYEHRSFTEIPTNPKYSPKR